jgi:flagellar motor switch protein FliM
VSLDVVLGETLLTLQQVRNFAAGQTIPLQKSPDDALELQCGGVLMGRAHIGQRCNNIAIRLTTDVSGNQTQ